MKGKPVIVEPGYRRSVALLVAGTFFMENLDATIIATAAPSIGISLGVDSASVAITVTAYLVSVAVLIPLSGWLTERYGSRRVFLSAIVLFTLASALCAASSTLVELASFRVLQGIGGAMMVPVGRLTVLRGTSKDELVRAIALLTWPALVAPVIAPLLGGVLATYASWRWIFLINLPLGVLAFGAGYRLLDHERPLRPQALDVTGLVLVGVGLGSMVGASSLLSSRSPNWPLAVLTGGGGVMILVAAVRHLRNTAHPLLDLSVLRIPTMRLAHAGGGVFRMTVSAVPFLLPLMFQDVFGWSAVRAGSVALFVFVGNLAIKPLTTPLLRRFGFRTVLLGATSMVLITMLGAAFLSSATPLWLTIALITVSGAARSVGFTGYNTIAFSDVPQSRMTAANTVASTLQQLAAGFGVAVAAMSVQAGSVLPWFAAGGSSGASGTAPFRFAFLAIAALTGLAVLEARGLDSRAGDNIRPAQRARTAPGTTSGN